MPSPGDIVTSASAATGRASLTALGAGFRAAGAAVGETRQTHHDLVVPARDAQLQPISRSVLEAAARTADASMVWANDDLCGPRAAVAAALIQRGAGGELLAGSREAYAAGVAIGRSEGILREGGWGFHAAAVFRVEGMQGLRVLDPLLFDRDVSLSRWARAIGTSASQVQVGSPFANAHGERATDPADSLLATWDRLPAGTKLDDRFRLDPDGTDTVMQRFRAMRDAA